MSPFGIFKFYLLLAFKRRKSHLDSDEDIAGSSLMTKHTFRFQESADKDLLIGFRAWIRALRNSRIRKAKPNSVHPKTVVFDVLEGHKPVREGQIHENTGNHIDLFIAREHLLKSISLQAWLLNLLVLGPIIAFWSAFSNRRKHIALMIFEILEASSLLEIIKQNRVQELYFYCAYEKDSNALYLLLKSQNVRVIKMFSPNLLSHLHEETLSDVAVLTSPYQRDEIEHLKYWRVKELYNWTPERFHQYKANYIDKNSTKAEFLLGYYSHGSWRRREMGHPDELGDMAAESEVLEKLSSILNKHSDWSIMIFLHPKEKGKVEHERIVRHYKHYFDSSQLNFAPREKSSAELFGLVDIGIGGISTILFERMFLGFKTVFYPCRFQGFPVIGSEIKKICTYSTDDLEGIIYELTRANAQDFFKSHNLSKYTYYEWLSDEYRLKEEFNHY